MKRWHLEPSHLVGARFAINVALATTIIWGVLHAIGAPNPIWGIASMVAASDPEPQEARRLFTCRLTNVAVGSVAGMLFLIAGGRQHWVLPVAMAATVLVSTYVVRIKTMWRQAPITAAVVIAAAITSDSSATGVAQGLRTVAEVVFGCLVGITVSLLMSRVWFIQPSTDRVSAA